MRKKILTLLTTLGICLAIAQKPPIKFGEIPMVDLKLTVYEKDSSASAVVLADYGETGLLYSQEKGFMLTHERLTRIKILTKEGLDEANFEIYLYHDGGNAEKISGLRAVTYNLENGKVAESKTKSESIFKEKFSENYDIMKVALPNVKEGSIVEISYKVLSDFITHFQDWDFQNSIPVRWSEYRARIPEYFTYDKYMQGYVQLTVNEQTTTPGFITITTKDRQSSGGLESRQRNFKMTRLSALRELSFTRFYPPQLAGIEYFLSRNGLSERTQDCSKKLGLLQTIP